MPRTRLTTARIEALHPRERRYEVRDSEVPGLVVVVHPTGHKVFNYRYRRSSDRRWQTVHIDVVKIGVAKARDLALKRASEVADRRDPARERRDERAAARQAEVEAEAERDKAAVHLFGAYLIGPTRRTPRRSRNVAPKRWRGSRGYSPSSSLST